MQDFNEFVNQNKNTKKPDGLDDNIFNMISSLSARFDGKNQTELLSAIFNEAKKGKERGTLTNKDIDNFAATIAPMLNDTQRAKLQSIVKKLKQT